MIQAIKYAIISASAGIIQAGSFALFNSVLKLGWTISYIISLALSVIWNYTINRKITFKSTANITIAMLKGLAFYAVFAPASTWLGNYLTGILGWNDYLVTGINMILNMVLEFFYFKYVVFPEKKEK